MRPDLNFLLFGLVLFTQNGAAKATASHVNSKYFLPSIYDFNKERLGARFYKFLKKNIHLHGSTIGLIPKRGETHFSAADPPEIFRSQIQIFHFAPFLRLKA